MENVRNCFFTNILATLNCTTTKKEKNFAKERNKKDTSYQEIRRNIWIRDLSIWLSKATKKSNEIENSEIGTKFQGTDKGQILFDFLKIK